ncbi:MAG: GntR family transcriptional regulator [Clostridiales bacterium]|nr:GntR family transcriptional regulator [Clostridiales bacterium]
MINLELQNPKPLRELVYEELKSQILKGTIVPGTRLMEIELADSIGVSRTPVREAIRKLEKEGLVVIEPRKGAYASQISTADMIDILEIRQDVEGLAAFFAATRITEAELRELRKVCASYNRAVEEGITPDMIRYDTKFHRIIAESTHNKTLVQIVEQLQEMVLRFRYIYYDNFKRAEKMPKEHGEILEAIARGDGEAARAAADVHIDRLKEIVVQENL